MSKDLNITLSNSDLCKPSDTKKLGYGALVNKGRRKAPKTRVKKEGAVLTRKKREQLIATTLELMRNDVVVNWMLRKHCDHVSTFSFQAKTGNSELNKLIEAAWEEWGEKENCDRARRHNLNDMIRLNEMGAITAGDSGLLKTTGFKLQGIESDRIAKPKEGLPEKYERIVDSEGLIKDAYSAVDKYIVCKRSEKGNGLIYQTAATWKQLIFHGYFTRFDQTRGVSPLVTAINKFLDMDECNEATLIKIKQHSMFGVAFSSDGDTGSGFNETDEATGEEPDEDTERYNFEMEVGYKFELEKGDSVDMLESKTPSTEYQNFIMLMIRLVLFALDFPYTVFDSKGSSYSASKQDRAEYETSAGEKRRRIINILKNIARWRMPDLLKNDKIVALMAKEGIKEDQIKYEFIPQGTPWIDELKEVTAAAMRIATGLSSRTLENKKKGQDVNDVFEDLELEERAIEDKNITIALGQPGQELLNSEDDNETEPTETEETTED